jgi:hypothetical protein
MRVLPEPVGGSKRLRCEGRKNFLRGMRWLPITEYRSLSPGEIFSQRMEVMEMGRVCIRREEGEHPPPRKPEKRASSLSLMSKEPNVPFGKQNSAVQCSFWQYSS